MSRYDMRCNEWNEMKIQMIDVTLYSVTLRITKTKCEVARYQEQMAVNDTSDWMGGVVWFGLVWIWVIIESVGHHEMDWMIGRNYKMKIMQSPYRISSNIWICLLETEWERVDWNWNRKEQIDVMCSWYTQTQHHSIPFHIHSPLCTLFLSPIYFIFKFISSFIIRRNLVAEPPVPSLLYMIEQWVHIHSSWAMPR